MIPAFALCRMALCMRWYANIASPRTNQLLALILFEGMANPAGRTADGKQSEPGAIGQLERVLQYSQGKVDGWRTTGDGRRFTYDRVGQRQRWRGWVEFREQGKQRHGAWVTVWVQAMPEAGEAFAAPQTF